MAEHTPGKLSQQWFVDAINLLDANGHSVAHIADRRLSWGGSPPDNASRLTACWNACDGIDPEAVPALLEAATEARREIAWLMDQVKARPNGSVDKAFTKLNAAIAKATNTEPTVNPLRRAR